MAGRTLGDIFICAAWDGGEQVFMACLCCALEGKSVGGTVVHKSIFVFDLPCCTAWICFDLIFFFLSPRHKAALVIKPNINLGCLPFTLPLTDIKTMPSTECFCPLLGSGGCSRGIFKKNFYVEEGAQLGVFSVNLKQLIH